MVDDDVDEALRALLGDVPEMDIRAFTAGRARLLATIGTPPMAEAATTRPDVLVLTLPPEPHRRSPPLRRAAPWLAVAAAVAVVAVGAVVLLPGDSSLSGSTPAGATTTTGQITAPPTEGRMPSPRPGEPLPAMPAKPLNSAGDWAARVADFPVPPGKVLYERSERSQAKDSTGLGGSELDELWIPADRDAEWLSRRTASGNIQGRSDKDFEEHRAKGGRFDQEEGHAPWSVTPSNVAALPRDPAALYDKLRAEVNAPLPNNMTTTAIAAELAAHTLISVLGDTTGGVPAGLRAAILRTLGYLPGITVTPGATTSDGRPAVILGWGNADAVVRNELLIDPGTARTVEWRNIAQRDFQGFTTGQTINSDLRTEAVVSQPGQRP